EDRGHVQLMGQRGQPGHGVRDRQAEHPDQRVRDADGERGQDGHGQQAKEQVGRGPAAPGSRLGRTWKRRCHQQIAPWVIPHCAVAVSRAVSVKPPRIPPTSGWVVMLTSTLAMSDPAGARQPIIVAPVTASTPPRPPVPYRLTRLAANSHAPGPITAVPLARSRGTSMLPAAARAACSAMSAARSLAFMAIPPSTISAVSITTATANTTVNTAMEPRSVLARGGGPAERRASMPAPGR